jgi:1,4-dihydroxy-2-naphthoate polyprenyltransferase
MSTGSKSIHFFDTESRAKLAAGIWRLADPKITLASMASLFLGTTAATIGGELSPAWLIVTILGIFFLEVAKNASGEIYDFDSGTDLRVRPEDRSPFSGGKRVLVDELLTRGQTWAIALTGYFLGALAGLAIVFLREPGVLWLGVLGAGLAFFYHAPPLRLSYRGLGELAVGLAYGPMIAAGTYLVQRGDVTLGTILSSIPLGILIACFLWINELPDHDADAASGKRTLVVSLGKRRASLMFPALMLTAFVAQAVFALTGQVPLWTSLSLLSMPFGIMASLRVVHAQGRTSDLVPAQKETLLAFLVFALGAGVGWLIMGV